jgi:hypothetical protein
MYDAQVRRRRPQDAKNVANLFVWRFHEAVVQLAAPERVA